MDWDLDKGEILKLTKMSLNGSKRFFSWKKAYAIIFEKFQVIKAILTSYHVSHQTSPQTKSWIGLRQGWNSENLQKWVWMAQNDIFHERRHTRSFLQSFKWLKHFDKLPYFTQTSPQTKYGLGLRQGWNSENLQKWVWIAQNDIFHERRHTRSFCKVSSDLKPFWQVTIFHIRLPHKPNHGWDLDKGEILKTYKNEFEWLKTIFFMKKGIRDLFWKVSSDFKPFDKLPYFTPDFPTNQIMDWDLDKSKILKTYKNEFEWLKTIFFMKKGIRDHFCTVSSDLKPFDKLPYFTPDFPTKPNHGLGLRQGRNSENLQNEFDWLKTIFFMKKGIRDHFYKVSSDFKHFDKLPYFTSDFPTNQIMDWDLDKGEILKLTKMSLTGLKRFFSWKKAYAIILQSFKWFQAILTSYHISHQTSPQTKSWIGT